MRRIILCLVLAISIVFFNRTISCAEEEKENVNTNDIIQSQKSSLGITDFLKETEKYSTDLLENTNVEKLFADAISGNIQEYSLGKRILERLFKEFFLTLQSIGTIITAVLLHSILKSVADELENDSISEVAYYTTYILIVTIIMKNFSDIIIIVKNSIENLVGFVNCLFPILLTLLATSGGIVSSTTLEPLILFLVTLIANGITKVLIPFSLVSVALNIVSQISSKVQINQLSKFINKTVVWILGIGLTIFVGITSLEGSISKRC